MYVDKDFRQYSKGPRKFIPSLYGGHHGFGLLERREYEDNNLKLESTIGKKKVKNSHT